MEVFEKRRFDNNILPEKNFGYSKYSLIISVLSLLLITVFTTLYFSLWYDHVDASNVKSVINNSDLNLSSLTVSGESNLNQTTYRKKIENITLLSVSAEIDISETQSGTTFVIYSNGDQSYFMRNVFLLPDATGSGRFYEFVFNDNITFADSGDGFLNWFNISSKFTGSFSYAIQGLAEGVNDGIVSAADNTTSDTIQIGNFKPFIAETGVSGGVYSGSILKFTDIKADLYLTEGVLIGNSGMSVANFASPFV